LRGANEGTICKTVLRPRLVMHLAMLGAALFMILLAVLLTHSGLAQDSWLAFLAILVLLGCAALYVAAGLVGLSRRRRWVISLTPGEFTLEGTRVERRAVSAVRRDSDLVFKGIAIDLIDGTCVRLPVQVHLPFRVLRAFRKHGYPVHED